MQDISVPDYYPQFSCTGPLCEDTCCSSWSVGIDRDTYHKYKQNRHPVLAPLFKLAVSKNTSADATNRSSFGVMKMREDGVCHFQQEDKLCAIHAHMGASALSDTCRLYPRYLNQFGTQRENSLGVSCPQAARLILLNPQPMQFLSMAPDPEIDARPFVSYRFPLNNDGDPTQIAVLNDFRAVIIAILQARDLSLGARLMVLGFLLEDAEKVFSSRSFADASELLPVLESFVAMLSHPAQLEIQFAQVTPNVPRKLELLAKLITQALAGSASARFKDCLLAAAQGLAAVPAGSTLERYAQSHAGFYQAFFQDRQYIFENYLVNQVITRLFPFARGSYLDLYRELVSNLSIIQGLLVGVAAQDKGLDEGRVIQVIQSFARYSNHNRNHLDQLLESLRAGAQDSFVHVMWLLREV